MKQTLENQIKIKGMGGRNVSLILNKEEAKMTISEACSRVERLKPNAYSYVEKIEWLSKLEGIIKKEIIDTHSDGENIVFNGYGYNTLPKTELIVKAPYDDIYIYWLEAQIDYFNGEIAKYNNSIATFNRGSPE